MEKTTPELDNINGLHNRLRIARERAGITQQQLAALCGVSRSAASQWESDNPDIRTAPKRQHLGTIAKALRVPMDWLILEPGEKLYTPDPERASNTQQLKEEPERYQEPGNEEFTTALNRAENAIYRIETHLKNHQIDITPEKKAGIIRMIMAACLRGNTPTQTEIEQLIKLAS